MSLLLLLQLSPRADAALSPGGGQLYLQLESGAVTTSIMQVSAAAAATVDQGKKKKKKKQSTTVRSKSPHHVSSSHATPAPAPAPTDMQLAMISLQQVAHGVSSSNSNSSSSNTIPAQQLLQLELNNSSSSFLGCSLQNQNLGSLHHHHPASSLAACLLTTGDPNNNNNNNQDGQQQHQMCPSATTPDDHIIQEQRFSPEEDHMRSHHDAGSSWQSSCEFTAATVSGGCSFNAHQLAGSSAAVNQRIEGTILLQQHDDDHEPAGLMLQQVGIREEQWSDNSNHHHLQTMCNDLPGQQQVMDSSWWGQKRVKTSQGFRFHMVTSSCAAVEAQPAAANPSPDQLEHGCMMQSRWKTLGPLQPLRSGLEMDNKQAAVVPRDHHQNNSSLTEFTSHCKSMELNSSNMLHESQQTMLTEMRNELPADAQQQQQQTLLSSAMTTATTCEITGNPNPRISIARLTDDQALMDFENHFTNHSMQNIAAAAAIDEENVSMLHDSPQQQQQQLEVVKNRVQGGGQLAAQAGSSVGFLHHGHVFAAAGSCDQTGLEWQGEGLGATCVNDYLLLTSAIHKAQLLDLQLKENQRHNNYTKQSEASPASTHVAVVHESSLHHHHHLHAQMVGHDGSGKSLLSSSSSLSDLIDSHQQQQQQDHERRIVVESGQDVVSHAAAAAAVQELYFSDQLLLDALAADHHQWFTASSREAYEKKTHHHDDPQQQQHHDDQILLPSDKRVFKRSSKGGPRRPNIIKGQWTPEEDRYTFLSLEKCVQV